MTFDHVTRWTWTGLLEVSYIQNIFFFYWDRKERAEMKMAQKHETLKWENLTEEEEEEEEQTSQINKPR